ncbi:hypothetical protein [Haloferula sp. BvORR071]|uniref:hypothetical protein n=1 Tax=Haloferula sp. BvORR071 TaxID=1396141 RepID=UPI00054F6868|nr:hypothetical protein [Haloferula sp. BvORR071]
MMIRPAKPADLPLILSLLDAVFAPSRCESRLVELAMQTSERTRHGWVMGKDENGDIIGYLLYTRPRMIWR